MGNSQSTDTPQSSSPSAGPRRAASKRSRERETSQHRGKAGSGHSSTAPKPVHKKSTAPSPSQATGQQHHHAPPSNLVSASSTAQASTSNTHAQATVSASPVSSHRRARSTTTSGAQSEQREDVAGSGQGDSKVRPNSRSATQSHPGDLDIQKTDSPTEAINVPGSSHDVYSAADIREYESAYGLGAPSDFSRPPRLPLPIENEHEPGSPIPSPADVTGPPLEADIDTALNRRSSMLSSTTLDDDDAADIEAFVLESNPSQPKVPTTFQYHDRTAKGVYVTGTFVKWERKFRLHRNPQTGSFSTTFPLPTGTHHLKFLVDGDMVTSEELPTTVDFTNALVNYIEVVAPPPTQAASPRGPSDPMPIPGTAGTMGQPSGSAEGATRSSAGRSGGPTSTGTSGTARGSLDASRQQPLGAGLASDPGSIQGGGEEGDDADKSQALLDKKTAWLPRPHYTTNIPAFLLDIDLYNTPEDERYQRALKASETLPGPPTLPGFMAKSILNVATPHKDDASVLAMPNHTTLNHLATSSIKNGVLATSGTTRYKRKFLTTIMYKPTSDDG